MTLTEMSLPRAIRELGTGRAVVVNQDEPRPAKRALAAVGLAYSLEYDRPHVITWPTAPSEDGWDRAIILAGIILFGEVAPLHMAAADIADRFGVALSFVVRWLSLIGGS